MSFCYGTLAYKTAWLSCHHPVEFAVANCTVNGDQEAITATLALAKKRGIQVLPPDINHSDVGFSMDNGAIRYGLKAIKGVGGSVINFIDTYRKQDTVPFKDFDDYYTRIHDPNNAIANGLLNALRAQTGKNTPNPMKKDVEVALILAGTFDFCESNRYKLLNHYLIDIKNEKQIKLMDAEKPEPLPLNESDYKRKVKLALEKYYMGSYISEHPLDPFPYADIESAQEDEMIQTTGILTAITAKTTKKGAEYLMLKFQTKDDIERTINVFNTELCDSLKQTLKKNQIIIVKGRVSKRYNNINATSVRPVAFKKQTLDTESIQIEDKTKAVEQPTFMSTTNTEFAPIF